MCVNELVSYKIVSILHRVRIRTDRQSVDVCFRKFAASEQGEQCSDADEVS